MKSTKWVILFGSILNIWLGIGLGKGIQIAILDFHSYDMALTMVRCLTVVLVWALVKCACLIPISEISSKVVRLKFWFLVVVGIDIAMYVAISFWPGHVGAFFGEPFVMRQRVI